MNAGILISFMFDILYNKISWDLKVDQEIYTITNVFLNKWIILKEKTKRLHNLKGSFGSFDCNRFYQSSSLLFSIWASFQVIFPALVTWMFKKLRVTSSLLIVFASREGSQWGGVYSSVHSGLRPNLFNKSDKR